MPGSRSSSGRTVGGAKAAGAKAPDGVPTNQSRKRKQEWWARRAGARLCPPYDSLLLRPVIPERRVALVELRLDAAAVTAEGRQVGAAGFGGEGQRLDFGAGAHRGAGTHDLHRTMHRALAELLQFHRHFCRALREVQCALLELGKRKRPRRKTRFAGL